jgi:hypothetical protein
MRKALVIILLLASYSSSLSQEAKSRHFEIGGNYVTAKTSSLGQGSNSGVGIFAGYVKKIDGRAQLTWKTRLGANRSAACQDPYNCNSWWFSENLWLSSTISKSTKIGVNGLLDYGLGYVLYYGSKITGRTTISENGVVISQSFGSQYVPRHGPMLDLTYSNREISENVSLNYTFASDLLSRFATGIHSFALVYRIPGKSTSYYEK